MRRATSTPRQPRHADVQEAQVGLVFQPGVPGVHAVDGFGHDAQFGPGLVQGLDELLARGFFVVGDDGRGGL
jgi:hypothetical protein